MHRRSSLFQQGRRRDGSERRLLDVLDLEFNIPGSPAWTHSQPTNLDLCLAKIDEQAGRKTSRPQVIQTLGDINIAQSLNGLDLDNAFAADRALLYLLQKCLRR